MVTRSLVQLSNPDAPRVELASLEVVWFQVAGTICNLRCEHCFISCAPDNDTFGFMDYTDFERHLSEAAALGAREFYLTGGEPFAHPRIADMLEAALAIGPTTVLTNATLLKDAALDRLASMSAASPHALEFRVSIDGYNAAMNDPIRGEGTFDRAMDGVARLARRGFAPIITMTRTWTGCDVTVLDEFRRALEDAGYREPRMKILPALQLGAEEKRTRGYRREERVTREMMAGFDPSQLVCHNARLVTDRGVWACPILPDFQEARMGDRLAEALEPCSLQHQACYTCFQHGAICSNETGCSASGDGA